MSFIEDLTFSKDERFTKAYKRRFMNLERIEEVLDLETQFKGIDKVLILKNGKRVTIEEKCRRKHYGDIALELWSNVEEGRLGWLYTTQAEYVAYMTPQRVYIIPTEQLKTAWHYNKEIWLREYPLKKSNTEGKYYTEWIPIPDTVLLKAIHETMNCNQEAWR